MKLQLIYVYYMILENRMLHSSTVISTLQWVGIKMPSEEYTRGWVSTFKQMNLTDK